MKKLIFILLFLACIVAFSAAQTTSTETFRQEGIASWYGKEFDGKPTTSGEEFDSMKFTAAHPSLPFGTLLIVTNKQNNHKVTVRVNDRGPFVATRIIDVSMAAADVLDMIHTGTAPVLLELAPNTALGAEAAVSPVVTETAQPQEVPVVEAMGMELVPVLEPVQVSAAPLVVTVSPPTETRTETSTPAVSAVPAYIPAAPAEIIGGIPSSGSSSLYRLQIGVYAAPKNAVDAFDKLKNIRLNPSYEKYGNFYRVVLAGLKAADISQIAQKLGDAGFKEALIREETGH